MKKLSYEYVKKYIEDRNCILISKEYKGNKDKLKIKCENGHVFEMSFNTFKSGHRCKECSIKNRIEKRKHTYEYVKNFIEKQGYILLSKKYKNNLEDLKMICDKGHIVNMNFGNFQRGHRCKKCAMEQNHESQKHNYEYVKKYIEKFEYKLLNKEYLNINSKLKMQCKEGHVFEMTFKNFKKGNRCPKCKQTNGESKIEYFLKENEIDFKYQYYFKDCKFKRLLPFDFYIPSKNMCIEYDGKQHYEINTYFGGYESFIDTKIRDTIKNIYCRENNIKLLRITYKDFNNIEKILENNLR